MPEQMKSAITSFILLCKSWRKWNNWLKTCNV